MKKMSSEFVIEPFQKGNKKEKDQKVPLIDTMNIGTFILTPLLVGVGFGLFFDSKTGKKPLFILLGLFLGCIGSFYNLFKIVQEQNIHARNKH